MDQLVVSVSQIHVFPIQHVLVVLHKHILYIIYILTHTAVIQNNLRTLQLACVCLSVCYHKIAVKLNYLKIIGGCRVSISLGLINIYSRHGWSIVIYKNANKHTRSVQNNFAIAVSLCEMNY